MSGVLMALFGGGSAVQAGSYTVNVGQLQSGFNFTYYGFGVSPSAYGSVSPTTFSGSGTSILTLGSTYQVSQFFTANILYFSISGSSPQSLFNSLIVGGQVYNSSSASYSTGTNTTWSWVIPSSDPFASNVGSSVVVSFT